MGTIGQRRSTSVATWLIGLAGLYRLWDRLADAEPLYRRGIAVFEKIFPPQHPKLRVACEEYAALLEQLERPDEAAVLRPKASTAEEN